MNKDTLLNGASPMKLNQGYSADKNLTPASPSAKAEQAREELISNSLNKFQNTGELKSPLGGFRGLLTTSTKHYPK
jgi:hypothetical protein